MCAGVFVCVHTLSTGAVSFSSAGNTSKAAEHLHGNQPLNPSASAVWNASSERWAGADEALHRTHNMPFSKAVPLPRDS